MGNGLSGLAALTGTAWEWMNEPRHWQLENGVLKMTATQAEDFFNDPQNESKVATAPFAYTELAGNFAVQVQVGVEMKAQCDSICLMMFDTEANWAKICFEHMNTEPSIVTVITRERSDDCISGRVAAQEPYLRLSRYDNVFAFHSSENGADWSVVRYFRQEMPETVKVGLVVQSPSGPECTGSFRSFRVLKNRERDVRIIGMAGEPS
ncbi:DUF1349 domain-containing protein [Paenibacillus sp. S150]|uniref:DUF1349 domain-containing protein n=1 Tax=Paenibacillus sp. S150 TaxID=2749826 RepID=UPI001C594FC6|nr:DUF1349 domain-containing protein [Paenibacillus sp. S150]MBW4081183.1 DUF1349 domain-containing protein [Paenibacillus sp. S150]